MQGTQVQSLVQEDLTCCEATKHVHHNYRAHEPQLLKPVLSRTCVLQLLSLHAAAVLKATCLQPCSTMKEATAIRNLCTTEE